MRFVYGKGYARRLRGGVSQHPYVIRFMRIATSASWLPIILLSKFRTNGFVAVVTGSAFGGTKVDLNKSGKIKNNLARAY